MGKHSDFIRYSFDLSSEKSPYHFYIADPWTSAPHKVEDDIRRFAAMREDDLSAGLEWALDDIDLADPARMTTEPFQGLLRGAFLATCLLKARLKYTLKTSPQQATSKMRAHLKALDNLQERLAGHRHAPYCLKLARFSHYPFRRVLIQICYEQQRLREESARQSAVAVATALSPSTGTTVKILESSSFSNAAYLPI